jgi:hypothetical protein
MFFIFRTGKSPFGMTLACSRARSSLHRDLFEALKKTMKEPRPKHVLQPYRASLERHAPRQRE